MSYFLLSSGDPATGLEEYFVDRQFAYSWSIFGVPVAATFEYEWSIFSAVSRIFEYEWNVHSYLMKSFAYVWSVTGYVQRGFSYLWDIGMSFGVRMKFAISDPQGITRFFRSR